MGGSAGHRETGEEVTGWDLETGRGKDCAEGGGDAAHTDIHR